MPLLRTVTTHLVGRRAARRVARLIPNPIVRAAAAVAVTTVVPLLIERIVARRKRR